MKGYLKEKLEKVKEECFKHLERMNTAKRKISHLFPLTIEKYDCLSDDEIAYIDQFLFRFSKLQDTMGTKLFPLTLLIVGEEIKDKPFIDRLNRLEELKLLEAEQWMHLREYRNEIAHEYSFNQDEVVDSINLVYEKSSELIAILDKVEKFVEEKLK
jgi:uncharacterized protein with HEPN domain